MGEGPSLGLLPWPSWGSQTNLVSPGISKHGLLPWELIGGVGGGRTFQAEEEQ